MPTSTTISGIFCFDPEDPIYQDHFPGFPVVPGTLLMDAFLRAAADFMDPDTDRVLKQFKFKSFVFPGEYRYTLAMEKEGIRCRLFDDSSELVSGVITHG